jgi:hypothetical protein
MVNCHWRTEKLDLGQTTEGHGKRMAGDGIGQEDPHPYPTPTPSRPQTLPPVGSPIFQT